MLPAGVENIVLLHPAQSVVPLFFLRIAQHLRPRGIGNRFDNEVAHAAKMSLLNFAPWRRVAVQDDADVRFTYLHSFPGRFLRIRHGQNKTGLQIDQPCYVVRAEIAAQKVQEPIVKFKLRGIGQGFGLQSAVIPFVTDIHVRVRILIPLGPVLLQGDITPFIGRPGIHLRFRRRLIIRCCRPVRLRCLGLRPGNVGRQSCVFHVSSSSLSNALSRVIQLFCGHSITSPRPIPTTCPKPIYVNLAMRLHCWYDPAHTSRPIPMILQQVRGQVRSLIASNRK